MSKHTPGKWEQVKFGDHLDIEVPGEYVICRIMLFNSIQAFNTEPDPGQANADLLCAAPEMFAALKRVKEMHNSAGAFKIGINIVIDEAIASAEGKQ